MENKMDSESSGHQDEVDLREVLGVLWAGRAKILVCVFLSAVIAVSYALYLPNKYTSIALLAPRGDGGSGGALGQLAAQYGGLASLAGVNLSGVGEQGKTAIALETLKSLDFFGKYLYETVLVNLMASKAWDRGADEVVIDEDLFDIKTQTWVREATGGFQVKPSVQEAYVDFQETFSVSEDKKSGFVTIAVTHYSPTVARDWVAQIVEGVNEAIRAREVKEAENSIAFLNQQRAKTNLVSLTEVFAELIEQQTKTVMLANASDEYVFQVIEPPVAPELKSEPQRALICVMGVFLGSILAVVYLLIQHYTTKETA